jgi:hypothetical protein
MTATSGTPHDGFGPKAAGALDLDAIEARVAAATFAPWYAHTHTIGGHLGYWVSHTPGQCVALINGPAVMMPDTAANAEFIAHARTDVPALVERVRALEAERDAVRAEMVEAQSHHESAADEVEFQCQRARALEAENARLRDDLTAAHLLGARGKGALEDRMQRAAAHLHVGAIGAALKELEP